MRTTFLKRKNDKTVQNQRKKYIYNIESHIYSVDFVWRERKKNCNGLYLKTRWKNIKKNYNKSLHF